MNKKVLLRDPWRVVEDMDTGLGNRLICWHIAYNIILQQDKDWEIITYPDEYPELEFLNFPRTSWIERGSKELESVALLDDDDLRAASSGSLFLNEVDVYETDYSWELLADIHYHDRNQRHVSLIDFKSQELKYAIQEYAKNIRTIHVRRGNGVYKTQKDIDKIPEDYRGYYHECLTCDRSYPFVSDSTIRQIVNNTEDKIFLSLDLIEDSVNYLKEEFPDRLFSRRDFILYYRELLDKLDFFREVAGLSTIGINIIDFYILAYSKHVYITRSSSWGLLAIKVAQAPYTFYQKEINLI